MNISDAERVSAVLECIKYKKTSNMSEADLIVVVMCSVRQSAVDRVHSLAEKFQEIKKKNPKLKTILTGCILKKDKRIFVNNFDYILNIKDLKRGNKLFAVPGPLVPQDKGGYQQTEKSFLPSDYLNITPKYSSKFSACVPIMTGCNNFCAYCVVPYAREREVSRSAKEIISEIKNLIKKGYKEIWLLGQNVNSYKDPSTSSGQAINFPKLLNMVNNIPGEFWIRFTSSHPKDFTEEVINAMSACKKITPYLNLPIQAGDDQVLKSMNRHYTVKEYKAKIKKLREKIPDISLSTDIIVGFPGETRKQFNNTAKLFYEVKYDFAYINKYSKRAGTAAFKLKDDVSTDEKKRREKVLTNILKKTALEKNKKLIGKETTVLINENRDEEYFGKNEQYKTIKVKSKKNIIGQLVKVKINQVSPFTLTGKLYE